MDYEKERTERAERIRKGGAEKYHQSNREKGKLFVRGGFPFSLTMTLS